MSVKGNIIKEIRAQLINNKIVKTVGLFNEQIVHDDKETYELPAVFVQFGEFLYTPLKKGSQKADYSIALHIIIDDYGRDEQKLFDKVEQVHQYIEQFKFTDSGGVATRFDELHDTDHERLIDWVAFYRVPIQDLSGDYRNLLDSGFVTLELTKCIGATIITTPIQGTTNKIINIIYQEQGDNEVEFTVEANQAGTYDAVNGTNTDTVVVEVDDGGGFSVVATPFVLQPTDEVKVTITRTDDSLQSAVVIQGIA